jgi:uncharacterized glyoxalase superfamily protein PhnB
MAKDKKGDKDGKKKDKSAKKEAKAARKSEKKAAKGGKSAGFRQATASLTVSDLDASLKFYQALGFSVRETWKDQAGKVMGYELEAGKSELMIGQDDFAKGRDRKKGEGIRFYYQTKDSIDDVAARVKAQGLTLESEPADQPWGARTFGLVDPDGFKLTISSAW